MTTKLETVTSAPKAMKAAKASKATKPSNEITTKNIDQTVIKAASPEIEKILFNIKPLNETAAMVNVLAIAKSGKELRKLMHETLCGIALHYADHGDYTALQQTRDAKNKPQGQVRLLEVTATAVSKGLATAMLTWLETYTSLRFRKDGDLKGRVYHNKKDRRIPAGKAGFIDMEGLDDPFWEMEAGQVYKPVDFNKLFADFLKRAQRLLKEKTKGREIDGGKVKKIDHEHIDDKVVANLTAFGKAHHLINVGNIAGNA